MAERRFNKAVIVFFARKVKEKTNTCTNYKVSKLIAESMKPFSDGEFFKECLLKVVHDFLQSSYQQEQ